VKIHTNINKSKHNYYNDDMLYKPAGGIAAKCSSVKLCVFSPDNSALC